MLAIQLTKEGEGPGFQFIKAEKQKMFMARQVARSDGAVTSDRSEKLKFAEPQVSFFLFFK